MNLSAFFKPIWKTSGSSDNIKASQLYIYYWHTRNVEGMNEVVT